MNGFAQTNSRGEYYDCYGNWYSSGVWWNSMWTNNSSVATIPYSTEQLYGTGGGETEVVGQYDFIEWSSDGMDCYRFYWLNEQASAPVDVTSPVSFINASEVGTGNSAEFFGGIPVTSLNISSCGGERFGIKIRFSLDFETTVTNVDSSLSPTGMFALAPSPVDGTYVEYYGNDNPRYTITYLRKVRSDGNRTLTHTVEGTSDGRPFTKPAAVILVCQ